MLTLDDIPAGNRPIVMGILNVTPDSFSDGGTFNSPAAAVEHARRMVADGADIIDIGAESTRPGAARVPAAQQITRLRDVLPAAARIGAMVSVDTTLSEVAAMALEAGASIINDVSAGRDDERMLPLAASADCAVVLMHMPGEPATMQRDIHYDDVVADVRAFLAGRLEAARSAGVRPERCIIDPGIGFGKRIEHNLELLNRLAELRSLARPILVGPSRKRFIGELTAEPEASRRAAGTIAACLAAFDRGATIFRVHDVREVRQALSVAAAIRQAPSASHKKTP